MSESRSEAEIFTDLRSLSHEPGFLHALSSIIFRDFFLSVTMDGQVKRDEARRYSRANLNNNELMLLAGLLVQSNNPDVFEKVANTEPLVSRADQLLEEFHNTLEAPMRQMFQTKIEPSAFEQHFGDIAKEAIYYGPESAFNQQYKRFARDRYRNDGTWLLTTKGISIRPIIDIAIYLERRVNVQMSVFVGEHTDTSETPQPHILSAALTVDKESLVEQFGEKALRFLDVFSIPINNNNKSFVDPFAFNEVNARPLIDFGQHVYIASQFKLSESIYESPYYWMLSDESYKDTASHNRGTFLEKNIAKLLKKVFGNDHVFSNVTIRRGKSEIAGEADVLVVYGEFILVIQAKSKRLTLRARSGDPEKINHDFQDAVQSAYDQAIEFADLIVSGAECEVGNNDIRRFKFLARTFPLVVLSDHFPSLTFLSNRLIKTNAGRFPAVVDIFFLEVMFEVLSDPVEVLYYFQQRTRFFEKIHSDSEFNLLGFHTKQKLYVGDEYDFAVIDQDFSADIDDYFIAKETGASPKNEFLPLEKRTGVAEIVDLIALLKSGPPEVAGLAIELLDFSSDSLRGIVDNIGKVQAEVKAGKALKAFSIETHYGGISYVAAKEQSQLSMRMADTIARRHKYKSKKNRWYVLFKIVGSPYLIDAILPICEEWVKSEEMETFTQQADGLLKTTFVPFKPSGPVSE